MAEADTREFPVACDWCGTTLVGRIRREQAGKMVLVHVAHLDGHSRPCRGSGRGIPVWEVRLELRAADDRYELVVGDGKPIECASRAILEAALRGFGVAGDGARQRVAGVEPGRPVAFDVPERRRQPRSPGGDAE